MVWSSKGLDVINPLLQSSSPEILCILVISNASSNVKSGKIVVNLSESIVLPEPGLPNK